MLSLFVDLLWRRKDCSWLGNDSKRTRKVSQIQQKCRICNTLAHDWLASHLIDRPRRGLARLGGLWIRSLSCRRPLCTASRSFRPVLAQVSVFLKFASLSCSLPPFTSFLRLIAFACSLHRFDSAARRSSVQQKRALSGSYALYSTNFRAAAASRHELHLDSGTFLNGFCSTFSSVTGSK